MAATKKKPQSTRLNLKDGEDDGEEFVVCGTCRKRDSPDKKGDNNWVECDSCADWFHHACVKFVFRAANPAIGSGPVEFTCTECRRSSSALKEMSKKLSDKIDSLGREMTAFKQQTSSELASVREKVAGNSKMIYDNREKIKDLQLHGNPILTQRVMSVEEDIQRRDCLLIVSLSNLPVIPNMNDFAIIEKIGSILQIAVRRNDIARCWRARVNDSRRIPRLFCRFIDARARNDFFFAWMARKDITLDLIAPSQPKTKIFIDAMLTSSALQIKQKAKAMVKEGKFASVYTLDGYVLVKRIGDTSGRRIYSLADLDLLVNSDQSTLQRNDGRPSGAQGGHPTHRLQRNAGGSVSGEQLGQISHQGPAPDLG